MTTAAVEPHSTCDRAAELELVVQRLRHRMNQAVGVLTRIDFTGDPGRATADVALARQILTGGPRP